MQTPDYAPHPTRRHWETGKPLMVRLINDANRNALDDFDELAELAGVVETTIAEIWAMESDGPDLPSLNDDHDPSDFECVFDYRDDALRRRFETEEALALHARAITAWPDDEDGSELRQLIEQS